MHCRIKHWDSFAGSAAVFIQGRYSHNIDLYFPLVHVQLRTHIQESLSPPSAVKHWKPESTAFSSEPQPCVSERERVFVISDAETERACESLPVLMDINTRSHEESRKCLRGCVMPSLITAHVAFTHSHCVC